MFSHLSCRLFTNASLRLACASQNTGRTGSVKNTTSTTPSDANKPPLASIAERAAVFEQLLLRHFLQSQVANMCIGNAMRGEESRVCVLANSLLWCVWVLPGGSHRARDFTAPHTKPKNSFADLALRCGPPAVIIHSGCQALLAELAELAKGDGGEAKS